MALFSLCCSAYLRYCSLSGRCVGRTDCAIQEWQCPCVPVYPMGPFSFPKQKGQHFWQKSIVATDIQTGLVPWHTAKRNRWQMKVWWCVWADSCKATVMWDDATWWLWVAGDTGKKRNVPVFFWSGLHSPSSQYSFTGLCYANKGTAQRLLSSLQTTSGSSLCIKTGLCLAI